MSVSSASFVGLVHGVGQRGLETFALFKFAFKMGLDLLDDGINF
jgi:hypothetical protein